MRRLDPVDRLIVRLDAVLSTAFGPEGDAAGVPGLSAAERRESVRLLRVDHSGEVAAQALYRGQGMAASSESVRNAMNRSALEESDHLAWCERRLGELGGQTSLLNPVWYAGAFGIGALAGLFGDAWSLGFLAETERQVVRHLDSHLERLPAADADSRELLLRMREDEGRHATTALESGGRELPWPVPTLMALCSRIMTGAAYWI